MGRALLRGWLAKGMPPQSLTVSEPDPSPELLSLQNDHGFKIAAPATTTEVLVLAVKPQTFVAEPALFAASVGPSTLVLSILAGQTLAGLRARLPQAAAIVRAMPNLPAAIGQGATGLAGESDRLTPHHTALATRLVTAVGLAEWLDETALDAVTAVSGSGPAYVFFLTECLAAAGEAAGLAPDVAARLARATVQGAAALMASDAQQTPASLREAVTSPGGTTAAALSVLRSEDGLAPLLRDAVAAARQRARELAG
jgi:pyrroline-5-carboxylate reductase